MLSKERISGGKPWEEKGGVTDPQAYQASLVKTIHSHRLIISLPSVSLLSFSDYIIYQLLLKSVIPHWMYKRNRRKKKKSADNSSILKKSNIGGIKSVLKLCFKALVNTLVYKN